MKIGDLVRFKGLHWDQSLGRQRRGDWAIVVPPRCVDVFLFGEAALFTCQGKYVVYYKSQLDVESDT